MSDRMPDALWHKISPNGIVSTCREEIPGGVKYIRAATLPDWLNVEAALADRKKVCEQEDILTAMANALSNLSEGMNEIYDSNPRVFAQEVKAAREAPLQQHIEYMARAA